MRQIYMLVNDFGFASCIFALMHCSMCFQVLAAEVGSKLGVCSTGREISLVFKDS